MDTRLRARFWIEACLAGVSGALVTLTLVWREWIELILRVDPDRHAGSLEWLVTGVLLVATLAFGTVAHLEGQRPVLRDRTAARL